MVSLGENIYLWRLFKGLTQQQLAKKAGIPRPNLSAIESGKREVSLATLRALAVAFGITPGIIVNGVAPIQFKKSPLSRQSLESIAQASLGRNRDFSVSWQKDISVMLSKVIKNRINACNKNYHSTFKKRQDYIANWLILKAGLETEVLNNLLSRLDKYIELRRD